ncbi:MAG: zf-HC2 domain-containing protein [Solirubrobacteraceae bacterium]|nr:zf-HC2 domain-containing protein [Solirubrobacteraceae bacterium]
MIQALLHPIQFRRDCRFTMDHASEYLDGELTAGEQERVEWHTSICPKCREMVRALRRTISGLRELRASPSPTDGGAAAGVLDALRRAPDPTVPAEAPTDDTHDGDP